VESPRPIARFFFSLSSSSICDCGGGGGIRPEVKKSNAHAAPIKARGLFFALRIDHLIHHAIAKMPAVPPAVAIENCINKFTDVALVAWTPIHDGCEGELYKAKSITRRRH
jgi:hypothetical protein